MAIYAFTFPILPGKTETLKKYFQEIKTSRWNDFLKSRQRMGVHEAHLFIQHTPNGDMGVISLDVDNTAKFNEMLMNSTDSFDVWFREKILIECQGMKPDARMPIQNELILEFNQMGQQKETKAYAETKKK